MIYHGIVSNGVVVLEGEKPREGTLVRIVPVQEPGREDLPAAGLWRDRQDLSTDSAEASMQLRMQVEQRHGKT